MTNGYHYLDICLQVVGLKNCLTNVMCQDFVGRSKGSNNL